MHGTMHGISKGTARSAANFLLAACLIGVATAGCSHPEEAAAGPQKETAGQSVTGSVTLSNKDRTAFNRALDELQAAMLVIPSEVYYHPKFTYIWTLAVGRFPDELRRRIGRSVALREIARCFLSGAEMTIPGELARVTGLSRVEAGLGNRALVAEGFAASPARGVYIRASTVTPPEESELTTGIATRS